MLQQIDDITTLNNKYSYVNESVIQRYIPKLLV